MALVFKIIYLLQMIVIITLPKCSEGVFKVHSKISSFPARGGPGEPLFLTPMIEAGNIKKAQDECKNNHFKSNITSYSGFLTVNKRYNSNMFFWFFPAQQNNDTAPVILWLQGGPGVTSLYGLFSENGPFSVKRKHGLKLRDYTWITTHSVIYIDNPVGTGFSFTDEGGYSKNEVDVGLNLYVALLQFFQLFPQYRKNDFFVTGESYAGKYVPALSNTIHSRNPSANVKINLKGLAIGNGFCDPEHMLGHYGDYLYQIGLLDSNGRDIFRAKERDVLKNIQQKKWKEAFTQFDTLINSDSINSPSIFQNLTGFNIYYNYLYTKDYDPSADMERYLAISDIRKNLHVGNTPFNQEAKKVAENLLEDRMQSVKPWVETLLQNYRILIYNGQLDIVVAYPLTEGFLDALNWSGAMDYKRAPRKQWLVENELAGYSKVARKLTVILVRNAGRMVPMDKPKWALDMISRFTRNIPF